MTIAEALREAAGRLHSARPPVTAHPGRDARLLLGFVLRREPSYLYAHPEAAVEPEALEQFRELIGRRAAGVPPQHLTGRQEFFGREFLVSPAALIPRPETELLVEAALERLPPDASARVVDVGTGSGCIGITLALERPRARLTATDISTDALTLARANALRLGAAVEFVAGDLLSPLPAEPELDAVVANPPYVTESEMESLAIEVRDHEPRGALVAGPEGTEMYARLIPEARARLRPGGWLLLELGYRSAAAVREMLAPGAWEQVETRRDLAGWDRVLMARAR